MPVLRVNHTELLDGEKILVVVKLSRLDWIESLKPVMLFVSFGTVGSSILRSRPRFWGLGLGFIVEEGAGLESTPVQF